MNNNPMNFLKSLGANINPQQIAMSMLTQNMNPLLANVVQMAQQGDSKGVEQFARNLCKEQGKNYDEEFSNFMRNFK